MLRELPRGEARQLFVKKPAFWALQVGQLGPAMGPEGSLHACRVDPADQLHGGVEPLPELLVRETKDRRVGHPGIGEEHILNFPGVDIHAPANHGEIAPVREI